MKVRPRITNCHINECLWNTHAKLRQAALVVGEALKLETTWGFLPAVKMDDTENGLDSLRVGNSGEPLGSILLDVVVKDLAVHHQLNLLNL